MAGMLCFSGRPEASGDTEGDDVKSLGGDRVAKIKNYIELPHRECARNRHLGRGNPQRRAVRH